MVPSKGIAMNLTAMIPATTHKWRSEPFKPAKVCPLDGTKTYPSVVCMIGEDNAHLLLRRFAPKIRVIMGIAASLETDQVEKGMDIRDLDK